MPIREYKCSDCGEITEVIQKINEKPLEKCPKCGGKLEKLISNSSFVLKGSGWYKTDYASSSKSPSHTAATTKENGKAASTSAPVNTSTASVPTAAAPCCSSGTEKACGTGTTDK
ncbi:MAG: zinc ribbon domain-containing protein [Deltaproteobacteria bacterium]|nr:zinc ribbon domain-containing protein [Deltaproteobacteria bacterium]